MQGLLRVRDVAEELDVHEITVRRWISDGRLGAVRLGAGPHAPIRVPAAELQHHLRPFGRASVAASVPQQAARSGSGANPEAS